MKAGATSVLPGTVKNRETRVGTGLLQGVKTLRRTPYGARISCTEKVDMVVIRIVKMFSIFLVRFLSQLPARHGITTAGFRQSHYCEPSRVK